MLRLRPTALSLTAAELKAFEHRTRYRNLLRQHMRPEELPRAVGHQILEASDVIGHDFDKTCIPPPDVTLDTSEGSDDQLVPDGAAETSSLFSQDPTQDWSISTRNAESIPHSTAEHETDTPESASNPQQIEPPGPPTPFSNLVYRGSRPLELPPPFSQTPRARVLRANAQDIRESHVSNDTLRFRGGESEHLDESFDIYEDSLPNLAQPQQTPGHQPESEDEDRIGESRTAPPRPRHPRTPTTTRQIRQSRQRSESFGGTTPTNQRRRQLEEAVGNVNEDRP